MAKRVLVQLGMLGVLGGLGSICTLAGPAAAQNCVGDCDASNTVTISELIKLVDIAGGDGSVTDCPSIDENSNHRADINELVDAVVSSISKCGTLPTPTFTATQAATNTATPSPSPTVPVGARCGNGTTEAGEDCDDGNNLGGDGCAANCTNETARKAQLDRAKSTSFVQSGSLQIKLQLTGQQVLITGRKRAEAVVDKDGNPLFNAGDIPVAIKVTGVKENDVFFDPVRVQGLVCACVRQIPVPGLFGPAHCSVTTGTSCAFDTDCPGDELCTGISSIGKIACGAEGLPDIDYHLRQDHNTDPGDANNGASNGSTHQLPNDPECNDSFTFPSGVVSDACVEGTGENCSAARYSHHGVCNSPRNLELFTVEGADHGPGSSLVSNNTAIGLLADNGTCDLTKPMVAGACKYPDYGPDCTPCTKDDADLGNAENLPTTTGFASSSLFDGNDHSGALAGNTIDQTDHNTCGTDADCDAGAQCRRTCVSSGFICTSDADCVTGDTCQADRRCDFICAGNRRCRTEAQGTKFNCDQLDANPTGGLSGACVAVTFPQIDALRIGDNVTSTVLCYQ